MSQRIYLSWEQNKQDVSIFLRWAAVRKEYDDSSLMYKYVTEDESRWGNSVCNSSDIVPISGQKLPQLKLPVQNLALRYSNTFILI